MTSSTVTAPAVSRPPVSPLAAAPTTIVRPPSPRASKARPTDVIFLDPPAESPTPHVPNQGRDPHRPAYHFVTTGSWMDEPSSLIQWDGRYHLFYQHSSGAVRPDSGQWGHAVSDNLVHWNHLPAAPDPTAGDFNEGSHLPDLGDWASPHVIGEAFGTTDFHAVGDAWECLDLMPLPDDKLGRFSGKHLLVLSARSKGWPQGQLLGFLGTYRDQRFVPEERVALDPGGYLYAPRSMADEHAANRASRRLQWGWLREGRSRDAQPEAEWSSVMSLPRELFLNRDGTLGVRPAAELSALRQTHHHFDPCPIDEILNRDLAAVRGDSLEIIAEIEPRDAARIDLELRCTPNGPHTNGPHTSGTRGSGTRGSGDECTRLFYDRILDRIGIDRWRSTRQLQGVDRDVRSTDFTPPHRRRYSAKREPLRLHVFLDRSVIEVFINERLYLASRIYPDCTDSLGLRLHVAGGRAALRSLDVWTLGSI